MTLTSQNKLNDVMTQVDKKIAIDNRRVTETGLQNIVEGLWLSLVKDLENLGTKYNLPSIKVANFPQQIKLTLNNKATNLAPPLRTVLLGRGASAHKNPGNIILRSLTNRTARLLSYTTLQKPVKIELTETLVKFFASNDFVISDGTEIQKFSDHTRNKIAHILRDSHRSYDRPRISRKSITQQDFQGVASVNSEAQHSFNLDQQDFQGVASVNSEAQHSFNLDQQASNKPMHFDDIQVNSVSSKNHSLHGKFNSNKLISSDDSQAPTDSSLTQNRLDFTANANDIPREITIPSKHVFPAEERAK